MHWVVGRRRRQHEAPLDAARRTARATRLSAAVALVTALGAVGGAVGAELLDTDSSAGQGSCTTLALSGYLFLYEDGVISRDEYNALRADAIDDELEDTGDCTPARSTGI